MAYCCRPWEPKSKREGPEYFRTALFCVSSKRSEEGKAHLYLFSFMSSNEFLISQREYSDIFDSENYILSTARHFHPFKPVWSESLILTHLTLLAEIYLFIYLLGVSGRI